MATKRTHTHPMDLSYQKSDHDCRGVQLIGRIFLIFLWKISPRGTANFGMCIDFIRKQTTTTILRSNFLFPPNYNFLMEFSDCGLCKRIYILYCVWTCVCICWAIWSALKTFSQHCVYELFAVTPIFFFYCLRGWY